MHKLLYFKPLPSSPFRHHLTTVTLPPHHHHHTTSPQPLQLPLQVSYNALFKPKLTCNLFVDHGQFTSTKPDFRRRNMLFNQPVSCHKTSEQVNCEKRRLSVDGVIKGLILTNVLVYLMWKVVDKNYMMQNFMVQLNTFKSGRYHTLITCSFSHIDTLHLVSNMIGLYFCGKRVGKQVGPEFLLMLYLSGAIVSSASFLVHREYLFRSRKKQLPKPGGSKVAALVHYIQWLVLQVKQLTKPDRSRCAGLGASGAVSAIVMVAELLSAADPSFLNSIIPTPVFISMVVIGSIWDDIDCIKADNGIAGAAHLGGNVVGFIAWVWLKLRWL